jgi:hypothetical protein
MGLCLSRPPVLFRISDLIERGLRIVMVDLIKPATDSVIDLRHVMGPIPSNQTTKRLSSLLSLFAGGVSAAGLGQCGAVSPRQARVGGQHERSLVSDGTSHRDVIQRIVLIDNLMIQRIVIHQVKWACPSVARFRSVPPTCLDVFSRLWYCVAPIYR